MHLSTDSICGFVTSPSNIVCEGKCTLNLPPEKFPPTAQEAKDGACTRGSGCGAKHDTCSYSMAVCVCVCVCGGMHERSRERVGGGGVSDSWSQLDDNSCLSLSVAVLHTLEHRLQGMSVCLSYVCVSSPDCKACLCVFPMSVCRVFHLLKWVKNRK